MARRRGGRGADSKGVYGWRKICGELPAKGHQFEMKADIPMSTQQREETRKKRIKDEEDAVMMKKSAALLGKPPKQEEGQAAGPQQQIRMPPRSRGN
jgi:hypothetical protein